MTLCFIGAKTPRNRYSKLTRSIVGAGLLAKAVCQSTSMLDVSPLSRASPLPHLDRHQIPKWGSSRLLHIDDDFFLPLLRKGLGGLFPRIRVFDRRHFLVLLVRQQLGLHVGRQCDVLGTDRTGVALGQV